MTELSSVGEKGSTPSLSAVRTSRELDAVDNAGADSSRPPGELPLELTSFIGREQEVAEVKRLLAGRRLLTLYGPGGCGKTRLALAVAQDLVEGFEDGVWCSDPKLVPGAVAYSTS